jgi:hypothetical protein
MRAGLHRSVSVQTDHDHVRPLLPLEAPDRLNVEIARGQQLLAVFAVVTRKSPQTVLADSIAKAIQVQK